jgi:hypothetical protein
MRFVCPGAEAYRNHTLQIPIQTVDILKYLFHALREINIGCGSR